MRKKNFNKLSKKKKIVLFAVIKKKVNVYYRLLISIVTTLNTQSFDCNQLSTTSDFISKSLQQYDNKIFFILVQ